MRLHLLTLLAALSPFALADVKFTAPAAGASIPAGAMTVTWKNSGVAPPISDLTTYTLVLVVGGNEVSTQTNLATFTSTGTFSSGNSITVTVSPGLAASTQNGFFLAMTSVASEGGIVINYSDRFTITGMTGVTGTAQVNAVTALDGATAGPPTVNQVSNGAAASGAAPAGGEWTVAYALQTGLTKYAPMQPVPGTKITAQSYTPLNPTSALTIATTWLPPASILTTLTESQTYSVSSMENTASPVAQPSDDMAKFLRRWKD